jgi:hypothetical protein
MNWTPERIETLTRLWLGGMSATDIARHFGGGMNKNHVIGKVHRLKLERAAPSKPTRNPTTGKLWTPDEDAILRRLHNAGMTAREMQASELKHRSVISIRDRRVKLGCVRQLDAYWSDEELATLKRMSLAGDSVTAICEALPGRSYNSVTKRRVILGIKVSKFVQIRRAIEKSATNPPKPKPAPAVSTNKGIGEAVRRLNAFTCRYPHGDPKIDGLYFCCEPIKLGRIYCDDHRARCFVA